mgnify:CR=1 FL=1
MAKYCTNCGKEIQENQDVCLNCGVTIKKTTTNLKSVGNDYDYFNQVKQCSVCIESGFD